MQSVVIEFPSQRIPPLLKPPQQSITEMKTDRQVQLERETNISNEKSERMAKQAIEKVFEQLRKAFENTQYNISLYLDELAGNKQVKLTQRSNGKTLVEIPPDIAVKIAEQAKRTTVGLFLDYIA